MHESVTFCPRIGGLVITPHVDFGSETQNWGRSIVISICLFVCLSVCVSVCPRAYLWNYVSYLYQLFVHFTFGCGSALFWWRYLRYVFYVLWMTSSLHIMARNISDARRAYLKCLNRKQHELRWGIRNNLPGINENVRERGLEQKCF